MFKKPFSYKGRIRRREYIISHLIMWTIYALIYKYLKSGGSPYVVLGYIPMYWFIFAQSCKRCHDLGNTGFAQLIPLYVLFLLCNNGQEGGNKYGLNPKVNEAILKPTEEKTDDNDVLERISNIVGLDGMTVNERLWESGLDKEFYYCKTYDKERAKQILRWLRVDEASINKIVD